MIVDTHTHIFPDNVAEDILKIISQTFKVKTYGKGTAGDLIAQMDENSVNYAVIHMVAVNPESTRKINSWLISLTEPRFIKFGTLHPRQKDYQQEIHRLKESGVRGVKLQPAVQGFVVDDSVAYPLYEELAKNEMTVMFHVGGNPIPGKNRYSTPSMILRVTRDFPDLIIIAAHLGGLNMWDEVKGTLAGRKNVYMETSMTYEDILPTVAENIMRAHGIRKIFFGTDYPFASVRKCIGSIQKIPFLNQKEKEDLVGRNAQRFFEL